MGHSRRTRLLALATSGTAIGGTTIAGWNKPAFAYPIRAGMAMGCASATNAFDFQGSNWTVNGEDLKATWTAGAHHWHDQLDSAGNSPLSDFIGTKNPVTREQLGAGFGDSVCTGGSPDVVKYRLDVDVVGDAAEITGNHESGHGHGFSHTGAYDNGGTWPDTPSSPPIMSTCIGLSLGSQAPPYTAKELYKDDRGQFERWYGNGNRFTGDGSFEDGYPDHGWETYSGTTTPASGGAWAGNDYVQLSGAGAKLLQWTRVEEASRLVRFGGRVAYRGGTSGSITVQLQYRHVEFDDPQPDPGCGFSNTLDLNKPHLVSDFAVVGADQTGSFRSTWGSIETPTVAVGNYAADMMLVIYKNTSTAVSLDDAYLFGTQLP